MAYHHGVRTIESPTSLVPPVKTNTSIPVIFGTAPINTADESLVNKPVLAYTYGEAVRKLGFSDRFEDYTISEAMDALFSKFNVSPAIFVNVLDPDKHKVSDVSQLTVTGGETVLKTTGILASTLAVKRGENQEDVSFDHSFDDEGYIHLFIEEDGEYEATFERLDPSQVTSSDIIGGVSVDGNYKGLELINHIFPLFRIVPGTVLAPGFSVDAEVAAVMTAKVQNINGLFKAFALIDIPTTEVTDYTNLATYKADKNLSSTYQAVCWPKVGLGDKQYHMSTQAACIIMATDIKHDDVPYKSPSNENLQADRAILADGTEITLGQDQAAYLNGEGIVTALNFIGGWKLWGNRTSVYPAVTDPKDSFIPIRRMFNYIQNNLILTYWQKVDNPTNRKLIESIQDSENINFNGMAAAGQILGGRVEFQESLNPTTSLMDGSVKFKVYMTPPSPAKEIVFDVEFDPSYLSNLFD